MIYPEDICAALKQIGIMEVILDNDGKDGEGIPTIEFNGFGGSPGEHFKIIMHNYDFAEHNL